MLEDYIAGDGMMSKAHGAHGHTVYKDEHEEEENPHIKTLLKLSPDDLILYFKGHHTKGHEKYIDDLEKRAEVLHEVHEAFHDEEVQGKVTKALLKEFGKVKLNDDKYKTLNKKLKDAHKDNDKEDLPQNIAEEHLKDMIDELLADLGYGLRGNREQNYTTFKAYMGQLKDHEKIIGEIYGELSTGKGRNAAKKILEALKVHKKGVYQGNIVSAVVTEDTPEFHAAYAHIIKEKTEKEVPGESVLEGLVAKDIKTAAVLAAKKEYEMITQQYKPREKKEEKHTPNAPAHH